MATVTGFTAARMLEIEDTTVVDGSIVGDELILETRDGTPINAGNVRGPQGLPGTNGTNGTNGAQGPAGPMDMVGPPINLNTAASQMNASGLMAGLTKTNISVIGGNTYGIKIDLTLQWSSVDADARWDFYFRLNTINTDRFAVVNPGVVGVSHQPLQGEVFWTPGVTASTDDIAVWAELVTPGALITPSGSATLKRKLWVVDYGVV